jgi:hypothetical protein
LHEAFCGCFVWPTLFTPDAALPADKPEDFIDRRFLDEMTRSGFFQKLWAEKP